MLADLHFCFYQTRRMISWQHSEWPLPLLASLLAHITLLIILSLSVTISPIKPLHVTISHNITPLAHPAVASSPTFTSHQPSLTKPTPRTALITKHSTLIPASVVINTPTRPYDSHLPNPNENTTVNVTDTTPDANKITTTQATSTTSLNNTTIPAVTPTVHETPARFDAAYLHNPQPVYPLSARRRGWQGEVLLTVWVSAAGEANKVEIAQSSSINSLDESAIAAVQSWRFVPAQRDGVAIASTVNVPIVFKLN